MSFVAAVAVKPGLTIGSENSWDLFFRSQPGTNFTWTQSLGEAERYPTALAADTAVSIIDERRYDTFVGSDAEAMHWSAERKHEASKPVHPFFKGDGDFDGLKVRQDAVLVPPAVRFITAQDTETDRVLVAYVATDGRTTIERVSSHLAAVLEGNDLTTGA